MRPIEFRGLNAKGQWEYGYVVREQFCGYDRDHYPECHNDEFLIYKKVGDDIISCGYKIHRDGHQSSVWVKRSTVGQYIGLKDKNGKKTWEGDIIRGLHDFGPGGYHEKAGIIEWKEDGYQMRYWQDYEVIGNKWENPGLIETQSPQAP